MKDFAIRVLSAPLGKTHLFSVGQAGFIIKSSSGQLLGIDLYLSDCVERVEGHMGFKRLLPKILEPSELAFDMLVATHKHLDHFDMDAMPLMMSNRNTRLLAAADCKAMVQRSEIESGRVSYVTPGDRVKDGDFMISFIDCDHGDGAPDAVGVIVEVDGKRVCETGDTCLRLDRLAEYTGCGPIDVLIAPINGAYGNLNEEECALLSESLKPGLTIPCHYGMFASHGGNPGKFFDIMRNQHPGNKIALMTQGERITI